MNHCLAEIDIHHREHRSRALKISERLAVLVDYPASPGCTPPYAPVWIAEMVRRREGERVLCQMSIAISSSANAVLLAQEVDDLKLAGSTQPAIQTTRNRTASVHIAPPW
jgi:alkylhydroperoxidase family enzyme